MPYRENQMLKGKTPTLILYFYDKW